MAEYDIVDKPAHYAEGRRYEPIDVFIDWELGALEWQVCKYLSRLGRKGDALEDAKKAQFYMNRLVDELEREQIGKVDADVITDGSISAEKFIGGPDFGIRHIKHAPDTHLTVNVAPEDNEKLVKLFLGHDTELA